MKAGWLREQLDHAIKEVEQWPRGMRRFAEEQGVIQPYEDQAMTIDEKALLPCPFCGGAAEIIGGGPGNAFCFCQSCRVSTDDHSEEGAIAAWNTRALPPSPATPEGWRPTHMHRKGATYRKIGEGFIEATMEEATIYEAVDGRIFVRPTAEFNDGRFSVINYFPAEEV